MSSDGRHLASTQWTRDGRSMTVYEDSPGVVHVTTEALSDLLRLAGFTETPEPIQEVAVQGQANVLRDDHGRCQECGTAPDETHRRDCPHHDPMTGRSVVGTYERRPSPIGEERR